MKVTINTNTCVVTREPGDKKIKGGNYLARGESNLLYKIKQILNSQGYDLIKKRMHKDGHLVDECKQYLRTRRKGAGIADIYIVNENWALYGADERYNQDGEVTLTVYRNVF